MADTRNILLGKITKIHGFEGAVAVKLEKNFSDDIPEMESVFLEIDGRPVPFFIDSIELINADKAYFTFSDYNTIEKIKEFVGCNIFVPSFRKVSDQGTGKPGIVGFSIVSENGKLLGKITTIIENPSQWLLEVESSKGKSILIPLHDDLIIEVDEKKQIIVMSIPDGLTEINNS